MGNASIQPFSEGHPEGDTGHHDAQGDQPDAGPPVGMSVRPTRHQTITTMRGMKANAQPGALVCRTGCVLTVF